MIKYREKMKEYELTLESPVLDPAFVSKAKEFENKLESNQLTEEEITAQDQELLDLFVSSHSFTEEDSEEVLQLKHKELVATAKADILEAKDLEALNILAVNYKDLPEVAAIIEEKIQKFQKEAQAKKDAHDAHEATLKRKNTIEAGTKEINTAKYEELQAMGEKYKEYPELIKLVNDRHTKEKPVNDDEELKKKLLAKSEWNYSALRAMGVTPTGNNMVVAGVKLEKEYLLEIYSVRK